MSGNRKASDIILSLETKITEILGYVRNQDMALKLLVNKLNKLENATATSPAISKAPSTPKAPQIPGLKPGVMVVPQKNGENRIFKASDIKESSEESEEEFIPVKNEEEVEKQELEVDQDPKGKRRDLRYTQELQNTGRKIPIQQQILYPDGKNVCMANVEIFDNDAQLIRKIRTNSAGKWNTALDPGLYLISISKSGTSNKPSVEASYQIDIPISRTPLELKPYRSE